ncbi:MAG: DUF3037 domain-containing protein [Armatimonadetes bacterium]|nr:DUF3037 domain-containing protein [Armatimonadota bacterium]
MLLQADTFSTYSCATLRCLVDPTRGITVPVGVVLWSRADRHPRFRLPSEGERIEDVPIQTVMPYLRAAQTQIEAWLRRGQLPYQTEPLESLSDRWWEHVRGLMQFTVQIDPPRPVDCVRPDEEMETLFEALVQPVKTARERAQRIDGAVKAALGRQYVTRFKRQQRAPGFRGRPVSVLRMAEGRNAVVVVEAVNLALKTAERDSDTLASRLRRIQENSTKRKVRLVLGYLASPGGLNGEGVLKDWIEHVTNTPMYDLTRQSAEFRRTAAEALAEAEDSLGVLAEG